MLRPERLSFKLRMEDRGSSERQSFLLVKYNELRLIAPWLREQLLGTRRTRKKGHALYTHSLPDMFRTSLMLSLHTLSQKFINRDI